MVRRAGRVLGVLGVVGVGLRFVAMLPLAMATDGCYAKPAPMRCANFRRAVRMWSYSFVKCADTAWLTTDGLDRLCARPENTGVDLRSIACIQH